MTDPAQLRRRTGRLGRLCQGHLHRHGGDDAFDARRRGTPPARTASCILVVEFAKPFRMPDFFLISGPVPGARHRPRLAHLSRPQGRAFRLFLRAVGDDPVRLQGAGLRRRASAGPASRSSIWNPSSSRSARCGSSICCRSSSSSPSSRARMPPLAIWLVAARRWRWRTSRPAGRVIDEFAARFVYFYSGYLFAPITSSRWPAGAQAHPRSALAGLALWALLNGVPGRMPASANGRSSRSRSGSPAPAPSSPSARCWRRCDWLDAAALLRRALDRHLSRLLPADGGHARSVLLKTGLIPDIGPISLIVTIAGVIGALADLVGCAARRCELPVRAAGRVLDRAEEAARRASAGRVIRLCVSARVKARNRACDFAR